mmetsp:Transcript_126435/g.219103  ORF Transcript_126435/g.219103 Transcript_126435/m.219103 type:complete len:95 (-) Transcript_126435:146-430(-)
MGTFGLFVMIGVSMPVYICLEGWNGTQTAWFIFNTITTIGMGDFIPASTFGEIWLYIMCFLTVGLATIIITCLSVIIPDALHRVKHKWTKLKPN